MIRLCFQRKNKTLAAIFKNKKVIEMLEENYQTFCSLNNKVPEDHDLKALVISVLEETGFAESRASKMSIEDFLTLLNAFLSKDIHFA
ncbi:dimethyladenosine transferase [Blastocystis sp. subtype 4]|uniref:dimethyladenosine transferase n=1 Tax=Blastocystis sp. subtype 4 TaxID=944170 RepID=UPI0007113B38|nr:dimethyladenosine transferase [Blastocystis sp. subtype 4]KNB43604.1 dimethyladenosine transferase [Blastocystis sp. subtype 4]|eukprot:XP_014527047.1 dimethyladenosine transferase [Blastocystis sp. subtype 4]